MENFLREGFVHGDLREASFIVPAKEPERILLIDFDQGGEPGEVVSFPTRLLHEDLTDGKAMKSLMITKVRRSMPSAFSQHFPAQQAIIVAPTGR